MADIDSGAFAPASYRRQMQLGLRMLDRAILLTQAADIVEVPTLTPADTLTATCEVAAGPLGLSSVVLLRRVAGQTRTLVWGACSLSVRERAWGRFAVLVEDEEDGVLHDGGHVVSIALRDERGGVIAMLHAEAHRALDEDDVEVLRELLALMAGTPRPHEHELGLPAHRRA